MNTYTPYLACYCIEVPRRQGHPVYMKFATRETCLSRDEIWISWLVDHGVREFFDVPNRPVYDYYVDRDSFRNTLARHAHSMYRNWAQHVRGYLPQKRRLLRIAAGVAGAVQDRDSAQTLNWYEKYIAAAYVFCEYVWGAWAVVYHVEPTVSARYTEHLDAIMALDRPTAFEEMKTKLHHLSADELVRRYAWVRTYSVFDPPYTLADFRRMKRRDDPVLTPSEYRTRRKHYQMVRSSISNPRFRRMLDMVHTYAWLKTDRIDTWKHAFYIMKPLYRLLSQRLHCSLEQSAHLTVSETRQVLQGDDIDIGALAGRAAYRSLYHFIPGQLSIIRRLSRIASYHRQLSGAATTISVLSGSSACPGVARGMVKIVGHSADVGKIKKGNIFIAKYTFPVFTPAMRRAAAIVTDEGGLTTHAAIIAREYGIPCVVGTKNATTVFKDGDMVEVDATKGIVRKI